MVFRLIAFLMLVLSLAAPAQATMPRPLEQCCLAMVQGKDTDANCPNPPPSRPQCEEIAAGWYAYVDKLKNVPPAPREAPPQAQPAVALAPQTATPPNPSWLDQIRQHPAGIALAIAPLILALAFVAVGGESLSAATKLRMLGLALSLPAQYDIAWLEVQALPQGVTAGAREGLAMLVFWGLHALWLGLLGWSGASALVLARSDKVLARWYGRLSLLACLGAAMLAWQIIPPRL